ncbi:CBS domain-containing protein [Ferruginibacter sp. SUN002]|uniref:CBS domain-containing protein n=1 Tax=Ferruginibacter sp. SUN002 TaxID=2937789 RepID=UPI003D361CFC
MQTVKDIFSAKQKTFNYIDSSALVIEALTMLQSVNLSYLIVMEEDQFKGIFGEREYARNVILKGRASNSTTVKEAMTTDVPVVDFDDTVEHCMNLLNTYKTRYILAYNDEGFAGVITINDLLRQVIYNKENVFDNSMAEQLLDANENDRIF